MKLIKYYFSNLFTNSTRNGIDQCIQKVPKRVTHEMNEELIREVREEEVKEVIFSMGGLKALGPNDLNGKFF
ncbi:Reverse transcriptase [Arachis hypogaea]|nr:Reverse transcriptase [Arachis hypogaea]